MGEVENKKLLEHYKSVIAGNFKTNNSVNNELIVSDAKKHLADLLKKNPSLEIKKEEVKSKVKA